MSGIIGFIGIGDPAENASALHLMVKSMVHEPFYTSGIYVNEQLGIWTGWVGHKDSFADCMPVWNETKDVCLIFSGEDFINRGEIEHLRAKGHDCELDNASYLVHFYEEMGLKFIEKLNGWFCGLLLDNRRGKAFLFNDRYGMQRIFIHEGKDGLFFASEAKALLAVLHREFDPKGIGEFLTCGCTLENRSLYKGLDLLPSGSLWTFSNGEVETRDSYFELESWVRQDYIQENQLVHQVVDLFDGLLQRYSGGTLPVGISLTGGLDSRMVMACLDMDHGEFPCYTFGSMFRDTFDVQVAREVAKAIKQPHQVLVLGEEFLRELPNYLEKAVYISDGYLGMSGAAELYVNFLARNIAPVRLTGNYGGELFRGVRAFKYEIPKGAFVRPSLMPELHAARTTVQELEITDAVTFALFHQAPSQGYGRLAVERSQIILRTPFMDNDLVKLVYQAPKHLLQDEKLAVAIISRYKSDLLKIPTDRGLLGGGSQVRGVIRQLHREALYRAEYFTSHGMPNWMAAISRFGLNGFLERSFLGRHKFQHFRLWTQKRFAGYITDVLLQGAEDLKEFFDGSQVESMVRAHLAGRQNYIDEIDKIMTLSLGYRTFFKSPPPL